LARERGIRGARRSVPVYVKVLSWTFLLMLAMVTGYWLADVLLARRFGGEVSQGPRFAPQVAPSAGSPDLPYSSEGSPSASGRREVGLFVYDGSGRALRFRDVLVSDLAENEILACLDRLTTALVSQGVAPSLPKPLVLHVFRAGEHLYLNLSEPFAASLREMGADRARLVVASMVRTLLENFPPVAAVHFLIGGKRPSSDLPVDLTRPWGVVGR